VIIVSLTAIAVALVQMRRAELIARHEIQKLQTNEVALRRQLWDQQVQLGRLTSPEVVRRRVEDMALPLVDKDKRPALAVGQRTPRQR